VKASPSVLKAAPNPKPPAFTYVNPFDKLEAASPRTRTPVAQGLRAPPPKMEILKPKHGLDGAATDSLDGKNNHTHKARKLSPGATTHPHETVAEAVSDLGEQIGQQVGEALAEAESQSQAQEAQEILDSLPAEEVQDMEQAIQDTASDIKKELEDVSNVKALEETLPKPMVEALKEVVNDIAQADVADVADNWESADAEEGTAKDETVIVYRFPMRAFSSIAVKDMPERRTTFLPELFMDIVRLKKDFDQIDRSLVSASKNFIVYALVKKGGFRIIRQENGRYRHVFENHQERIFNIALCTTGDEVTEPLESILGIGVNGTVFWTSLEPNREDQFGEDLDTRGLLLPPSPSQDDNTSGGQLKTRAKPSSRHPEFFAVGRGKSIHIVWPRVAAEYLRGDTRICHTEKYLKERSLKILTGKAGKDFTFSEDDTVIVSLDKAGRMRFWDIRSLTERDLGIPRGPPRCVEVSETLLEFHTTSPTAKSWPTSVFFFDKDKPFNKGIALRYVMVGMKQNHAFQLWDLGLGKAVQEIILPHEKESDAICSVAFHPKTGIMAVAHPTRNSVFFVHVSCPRYNLPVMSQAAYITRLNSKDRLQPPLPSVNATAIMTSISEYSFATKGQIRSLHMLNDPAGPPDVDDPDNTALFELYVMHSKGVCTLRVRRSDLGWKKEGEPLNPREAEQEGIITLSQLKAPQPIPDESSTGGDTPVPPKAASDRSARESIKKESSNVSRQSMTPEAAMRASTLAKVESKQDAARAAIINGGEKSEKKKKKRSTAEAVSQASTSTRAPPPSYAQAAQAAPRSKSPSRPEITTTETSTKSTDTEAPEWAKKLISQHFQPASTSSSTPSPEIDSKKLQEIVQAEITNGFARELDVMYKRFDEDKRVLNAANGAKQEAILRLVSSTLTENVEGVMLKMINQSVRDIVLPQVLASTTSTLEKAVSSNLKAVLPAYLAKEIPDSVIRALKSPQMMQSLSEPISKKLREGLNASLPASIQPMVTASVGTVMTPAFADLSTLVKTQVGDQLREANEQRLADSTRISKLTETVGLLTETIQTMAASQAELQEGFLKLQQLLSQQTQLLSQQSSQGSVVERSPQTNRSPEKLPQKTPEQLEAESITRLMSEGNYEQGTMQWLQSNRTSELFDTVFVRCNPAYLNRVSPLLALSTGAVVTEALEHNLTERLIWLDAVLKNVDPNVSNHLYKMCYYTKNSKDNEIHDIVPKIMDVMNQRLTATYIKLNESSPGNQLLRRISSLVSKVNELARVVTSHA
jgi:WD40 repeat protein